MSDLEERVARLPSWAREHIERLVINRDLAIENGAINRKKVQQLKDRIKTLENRNQAMLAIFDGSGRSGNETAQAFVSRIVDEWKDEPEDGQT